MLLALCAAVPALLSGCSSMQMYEEGVDSENPNEQFRYPMPIEHGKTGEFSYKCADGVWIDVYYPAQYGYWTPGENPEIHRDADLVSVVSIAFGGKESVHITDFSADFTVLDKKGKKIEPKSTQRTETGCNWSFVAGSFPRKITVTYEVHFRNNGIPCEFSYSAQLTQRNRSMWFIKLLNLVYL